MSRVLQCMCLNLTQANQTRHKGLRGQYPGVRHIHSLHVRCGWIQLSVSNSCHLSSFTLWFAATHRWRKLLVEEGSHIQSYPCGRCFPCISRVLSAVLGQGSGVIGVAKENSHPTWLPLSESSDLIEPSLGMVSSLVPWGYNPAPSLIDHKDR